MQYFDYNCGGQFLTNSTTNVSDGNWHHIALVRADSTFTMYIDGTADGTGSCSAGLGTDQYSFSIGGAPVLGGGDLNWFEGNMDEVRISTGIARWTENFSPPTEDYESDSNTKVLLHFDGDSSGVGHDIAFTEGVKIDSSVGKFEGSYLLDGVDDCLEIPSHEDFGFGTESFTLDGWVNFSEFSDYDTFMSHGVNTDGNEWWWGLGAGDMQFVIYNPSGGEHIRMRSSWTPTTDQWYHLALVKDATDNSLTMYVDGSSIGTATNSTDIQTSSPSLYLGCQRGQYNYVSGHLDEFRLSKGVARWTEDFTSPSSSSGTGTVGGLFYMDSQGREYRVNLTQE